MRVVLEVVRFRFGRQHLSEYSAGACMSHPRIFSHENPKKFWVLGSLLRFCLGCDSVFGGDFSLWCVSVLVPLRYLVSTPLSLPLSFHACNGHPTPASVYFSSLPVSSLLCQKRLCRTPWPVSRISSLLSRQNCRLRLSYRFRTKQTHAPRTTSCKMLH